MYTVQKLATIIIHRRRRSEVTVQQARRIVVSENLVLENQLQLQIYTQNVSRYTQSGYMHAYI